jgi:hypothetical protein
MTSRAKAKDTETDKAAEDTAAQDTSKAKAPALCGTVHTLPLLAHVACQRTAHHTDDPPHGSDQGKHHARVAGVSYVW